jgi:hypothetical protein
MSRLRNVKGLDVDNGQRLKVAIDEFVTATQRALDDGHNGSVSLSINIHCGAIKEQPEIRRVYYPRLS